MTDPGVVTPDKNAESELSAAQLAHLVMEDELRGHDALDELVRRAHAYAQTPQAPRPAPGTPQRGSGDPGDDEALRAFPVPDEFVNAGHRAYVEQIIEASGFRVRDSPMELLVVETILGAVWPLVVAYGDQRAAEALREAAADWPDAWVLQNGMVCHWLRARADEIHGRHAL